MNSSHFGNPLVTSDVGSKQYSNNRYRRRSSGRRIFPKGDNNIKQNNNDTYLQQHHFPQSPRSIHHNPSMIASTTTTDLTYSLPSLSRSTSLSYDSASSIGLPSLYPVARRRGKICHQFDSYILEELEEFDEMFSQKFVDNHTYCNINEHDCPSSSDTYFTLLVEMRKASKKMRYQW
mmetsp:Transcript_56192/g.63603  ORF Transcript_56192/g.63603 Transcript_56192/m.63603 type:complete len:177 (-) Transcript_56192:165-695(-)